MRFHIIKVFTEICTYIGYYFTLGIWNNLSLTYEWHTWILLDDELFLKFLASTDVESSVFAERR